jgi:hypothetical protein
MFHSKSNAFIGNIYVKVNNVLTLKTTQKSTPPIIVPTISDPVINLSQKL